MDGEKIEIAPSILSADITRLGEQVREAEKAGANAIHIDVMDGVFVPRITFGSIIVEAIRSITSLPLEVHLMIESPENQLEQFIAAGANTLIIHIESTDQPKDVIQQIHKSGARGAITLNPETSLSAIEPLLDDVDQVQIMGVNPGWSGQTFIPESLNRLRKIRTMLNSIENNPVLEIDGGVNEKTATEVVNAGATLLVAGSSVFNLQESVTKSLRRLRESIAHG